MVNDLKTANLFNKTFLVRGNHDDLVSGSASLWENYFETAPNIKTFPSGVNNYVSLNSNSDTETYSFTYKNSIFIALDDPGGVDMITSAELAFLNERLTYGEGQGLTHAFIYFHGPLYCVESVHCMCSAKADGSCTPPALVTILNNHPIVSATFHGHEHLFGWTHMDNTRVAGLTGSFEQFITSPSGGWNYNAYLYPDRMDYYSPDGGADQGFGYITVNGDSFTFSIYKDDQTLPIWSHTFSKGPATFTMTGTLPTSTPTFTPTNTATATPTSTSISPDTITAFDTHSNWKYYPFNTDLLSIPVPYYSTSFDDSTWSSGNGILGFGETYLTTTFANNSGYTYYFRKTFNIPEDPATITSLTLAATYDDGMVVYINGEEVTRDYVPAGTDTYLTPGISNELSEQYHSFGLSDYISYLVQGTNVIAVDVHNSRTDSSDIVWDASLFYEAPPATTPTSTFTPNPGGSNLLVYPYIGNPTTNSVTISWATDNSGTGEVHYSQDLSYGSVAAASSSLSDGRFWYSATITGLAANTSYNYKIFNNGYDLTPWTSIAFATSPGNSETNYNFAVLGDSQPFSAAATPYPEAVSIANRMRLQNPDLVLHTGDMTFDAAACTGNASIWSQYVRNYFNVYRPMLGSVPFFPALGNHEVKNDAGCAYQAFKNIFSLPTNGPSGHAEEYYSFDWGNGHFVVLDFEPIYRDRFS